MCVTEHLEGVYILPVNNLGAREDAQQSTATGQFTDSGSSLYSDDNIEETTDKKDKKYRDAGSGNMGRSSAAAVAGASGPTAARLPPRAAAATAFPSLLHLASQGQRRRAAVDGEVAYPAAEPIFVASLARRGGGDGSGKGSRRDKRHSTGSGGGGRTSSADGGSRHQPRSKPFQCIWWAARNGDHFAIIGGPDGEVREGGKKVICSGFTPENNKMAKQKGWWVKSDVLLSRACCLKNRCFICFLVVVRMSHGRTRLPAMVIRVYPLSWNWKSGDITVAKSP